MDEKCSGHSLNAPEPSGAPLHLPVCGVVERRSIDLLAILLRTHVAPTGRRRKEGTEYQVSSDLLTQDADFGSDICVRRAGVDPATDGRYLEEIAFVVVSTQSEQKVIERAEVMHRYGVRRIFGIWAEDQPRACEWSAERGSWLSLVEDLEIDDPCFAYDPLLVKNLLTCASIRKLFFTVAPDPAEAARAQGLTEGRAESLLAVLQARGIAVPGAIRQRILAQKDAERLEHWLKKAAVATSVAEVIDEPS